MYWKYVHMPWVYILHTHVQWQQFIVPCSIENALKYVVFSLDIEICVEKYVENVENNIKTTTTTNGKQMK